MIYDDFKHNLIERIETERDIVISEKHKNNFLPDRLFRISDTNDDVYNTILSKSEQIALQLTREFIIKHCNETGIPCENDQRHSNHELKLKLNNEDHFVILRTEPRQYNAEMRAQLVSKYQGSSTPVDFVFLIENNFNGKATIERFLNILGEEGGHCFFGYSLEEYLSLLFGIEDGQMFHNAMSNYKEEVHKAIGYQITEICSPENLKKLKETLIEGIPSFNYEEIKNKKYEEVRDPKTNQQYEIYNNNFESIKKVYLGSDNYRTGRYRLLLKNSDFAESFLTSEWLYKRYISSEQKYDSTEQLDNTFIVSGYLKSIEQLLWDIIYIIGQGRSIERKGNYYDYIEINKANLSDIDMTLGSLEYFLGDYDNDDIWIQHNRFVSKYIKAQIDDWKNKNRNGYFHKDNLHDVAKVKKIRDDTYFLYMLILGSIRLNEEQLEKLS